MKIIYQADNGRQFDTADECKTYEQKIRVYSCMHAVDDMGKVLSPESPYFIDCAIIVNLETEEAVAEFIHEGSENASNVSGITTPGTYIWSSIEGKWQTEYDFLNCWTKFIEKAKLAFGI